MMKEGVHTIIQKIHEDGEHHGNERYSQMKSEIDESIEKENLFYREDLEKRKEIFVKHNEVELSRMLEQMNSRLNREYLNYQHLLIDDIFKETVQQLRNLSAAEFATFFENSVVSLSGEFTLFIGALSQHQFNSNILAVVQEKNPALTIMDSGKKIPFKSGFLLRNERVEYNCLFEDVVEDMKDNHATAILKEVFEN